jgi:GH24 family phage-related lysozyme (muramidase)
MYSSVADAFWKFTADREGSLDFMYADVKNLVTTGIGNLIDPINTALNLPWRHRATGELASGPEIVSAWNTVKGRIDLNQKGGGYYRNVTDLYLDKEAIQELVRQRLNQNEAILRQGFPNYDSLPADAQLGILSMAWAAGPYFYKSFPMFTKAVNSGDYVTAAVQSHMKGLNADRQIANRELFANAADVIAKGADFATLYWPNTVVKAGVGVAGTGIVVGLGFLTYHLLKKWIGV